MKKTFEELINDFIKDNDLGHYSNLSFKEWVDFMRVVREKSLEEAANKADADVNFISKYCKDYINKEDYEIYVLKESILQLDKDSIEI